jgi:hypothetical protein
MLDMCTLEAFVKMARWCTNYTADHHSSRPITLWSLTGLEHAFVVDQVDLFLDF